MTTGLLVSPAMLHRLLELPDDVQIFLGTQGKRPFKPSFANETPGADCV